MPKVKRSSIDEIRQRVSLLDVASSHTRMKRAGAQWRGLSPFGPEKTPSFFVHPEKNVFHCYSTGNAGDLFRFVELTENLSFHEALEALSTRYGIPLEYEDDGTPPERLSLRKELFDLHDALTVYYHQCLVSDTPEAGRMRQYWTEQRGFSMELAKELSIGFAPDKPGELLDYLQARKFSAEALRQCGLLFFSRDPRHPGIRFRGRLVIPIRDIQGRVIAFTARKTDLTPESDPSHEAKYVNSPETPIFTKGRVLFGLERARLHLGKAQSEPLVLVEGQLDVLRCWQHGIVTAVAPQGTAVTREQLDLMRRYSSEVECVLDGDKAGTGAALRLLPMALAAGVEMRFLPLPEGVDPDDFLREHGAPGFNDCRTKALSSVAFAVEALLAKEADSPRAKADAIREILGMLAQCDSQVARQAYLADLARLSGFSLDALQADYNRYTSRQAPVVAAKTDMDPVGGHTLYLTKAESELLILLLNYADLSGKISEIVDPEWLDKGSLGGRLLARVIVEISEGLWEGPENLAHLLENDEEKNYLYALLQRSIPFPDPLEAANGIIKQLYLRHLGVQIKAVEQRLRNVSDDAVEARNALARERIALRQLKANIPSIHG